jgi:hypothetical protein
VGSCCSFSLFLPRPSLDQHRYDTSRLAMPPLLSHNGLIATSHIRHAQVLPVYGVEATMRIITHYHENIATNMHSFGYCVVYGLIGWLIDRSVWEALLMGSVGIMERRPEFERMVSAQCDAM